MDRKSGIIILSLTLLLLFLSGCVDSGPDLQLNESGNPLMTQNEAKPIRITTFDNCGKKVGSYISINATVMYLDCYENQLGGSQQIGPLVCYYGLQDEDKCLYYVDGWISATANHSKPLAIFNHFVFGENVEYHGNVLDSYSEYCNYGSEERFECHFLILNDITKKGRTA